MIKTSSLNNKNILENLYRILRMSLLLGDTESKDETIANFDDTARKIDALDNEEYNQDVKQYMYTTVTLEEEQQKLEGLIKCLDERLTARKKIESEYQEAIGHSIEGLDPITEAESLPHYESRLTNIKEYLDNIKKIEATNQELSDLIEKLEAEKKLKVGFESSNEEMEDKLRQAFTDIAKQVDGDYYNNISPNTITADLEELSKIIRENQQSLNIFTKSYETLRNAGISSQQEIEYSKYVREAREMYYANREQEYMLKLYQSVIDIAVAFDALYEKRCQINQLLEERLDLRKQLNINTNDVLLPLYNLLDEQFAEVTTEKSNVENIASLEEKIAFKQTKLENLNSDNQKPAILELLKEFCLIDSIDIAVSEEAPITLEETPEVLEPNTIIEVSDVPASINLDIIKTKTNTVMKRVGEMLGLKDKTIKQEPSSNALPKVEAAPVQVQELPPMAPVTPEPLPEIPAMPVTPSNEIPLPPLEPPVISAPVNQEVASNNNSNINNIDDVFWPEDINLFPQDQSASKDLPTNNIEMPSLPENQ